MHTAVDCGLPPSTANGQVSAPTTTLNSNATYHCDSGYELESGSPTEAIACQVDGAWSSSAPSCNGKHSHSILSLVSSGTEKVDSGCQSIIMPYVPAIYSAFSPLP